MNGNRILYIDDEEAILNMIQKFVGYWGYQMDTYVNPYDALEVFESGVYNLVMLDLTLGLPKTGIDFAYDVRGTDSEVPIWIVTGSGKLDLSKYGGVIQKGLVKPITLGLREHLDELLLE